MVCSVENRDDLGKLNELGSLQSQVKALRSLDKLGEQNFHEDLVKVFEPVTNSNENFSEVIAKTIVVTSQEKNKAIVCISNKLLEILNVRCPIAYYLLSNLSKIDNTEHTNQDKLVRDPQSSRVNDLLINKTLPVTLCNTLLTIYDTDIKFELKKKI